MRRRILAVLSILAVPWAGPLGAGEAAAEGWKAYAVRDELAPRSWTERDPEGRLLLGLAGKGDAAVDGRASGAPFPLGG